MTNDAFQLVTFRGRLMDKKTQAFLEQMEAELDYQLTIVQGCYNPGGVAASGGTHDGGGVVDLAAWDAERKVRVARELGAFAWHRPDRPGLWGEHVHLGIRDHGRLSAAAAAQQVDYDATPPRDGLAGHAGDPTWHPKPPVTFVYPVKEKPVAPKPTRITKARDAIAAGMHNLGEAAALLEDADARRAGVNEDQVKALRTARRNSRLVLEHLPKR